MCPWCRPFGHDPEFMTEGQNIDGAVNHGVVRNLRSKPPVHLLLYRPITPEQDPKIPESSGIGQRSDHPVHPPGMWATYQLEPCIKICWSPFQSLQHSAASCSTQFQCVLKVNTTTSSAKKSRGAILRPSRSVQRMQLSPRSFWNQMTHHESDIPTVSSADLVISLLQTYKAHAEWMGKLSGWAQQFNKVK